MESFEQRMAELTPEETRIINAKKDAMRLESERCKRREVNQPHATDDHETAS